MSREEVGVTVVQTPQPSRRTLRTTPQAQAQAHAQAPHSMRSIMSLFRKIRSLGEGEGLTAALHRYQHRIRTVFHE